MSEFKKIITHERPHLDEVAAMWLLQKFGEVMFPGISTAEVIFWSNGGGTPDGRTAEEYEQEGTLLLGIGRGRFDEHPNNGESKDGECAATLVAKALGVDNDLALEKILKFVVNNDLSGSGHPFDIASLSQLFFAQLENPKKIIEWMIKGLEAKYQEQLQFWTLTKDAFEKIAEVEEVSGPRGQALKMVTVVSDDELMSKFARAANGGGAAIVIQRQNSGNTQIHINNSLGLKLYDIAQAIRLAEQQAKGLIVTNNWVALAGEGTVEGAEEWYYQHATQALLNGSLSAKNVPPTHLSLRQIKDIVRIGINPAAFEPQHAEACKGGTCTSTRGDQCPWYAWGFHRCRTVRYNQHKSR